MPLDNSVCANRTQTGLITINQHLIDSKRVYETICPQLNTKHSNLKKYEIPYNETARDLLVDSIEGVLVGQRHQNVITIAFVTGRTQNIQCENLFILYKKIN